MKNISVLFLYLLIYWVAPAQQKEILNEDFSSNKNKWLTGEVANLSVKVENGKYIIDNNSNRSLTPQVLAAVDSIKDFEISVSITSLSTKSDGAACGLIFGSNMYRRFCFFIRPSSGEYGLIETYNNKMGSIITLTESPYINKGMNVTNRLKLSKSGKVWKLYINDSLVRKKPALRLYGPYMGVYSENMKAEYDDLKVSGEPIATSGTLCALFPLIYQSAKNNFEYIREMPVKAGDTTQYYTSLTIDNNNDAMIFFSNSGVFFNVLLKKYSTKEIATLEMKSLIAELTKCLPNFLFTENKNDKGEIEYNITEKIKKTGPEINSKLLVNETNVLLSVSNWFK